MTDREKDATFSGIKRSEIRRRVRFAAEVFEKHGDQIRAIIHSNVKDKSKEDDIFQEFFVSIVRKPIPSRIQDFYSYIFRAITNDVIDLTRSRSHPKVCRMP